MDLDEFLNEIGSEFGNLSFRDELFEGLVEEQEEAVVAQKLDPSDKTDFLEDADEVLDKLGHALEDKGSVLKSTNFHSLDNFK